MPQPDRCAEPGSGQFTLDRALARMRALVQPPEAIERVPLKAARGRVLARNLSAPLDLPPFASSAMDGYAVHGDDLDGLRPLPVAGTSLAGHPYDRELGPGQCVRVFTGARVPEGSAAVVPQEDVGVHDQVVRLSGPVPPGDYIRPRGDDVQAGTLLLSAGRRLDAADLGLLAASALLEVPAFARPRVAFLTTGDELRPTWLPLDAGQIHDSNRYLLAAALADLGVDALDLGSVPDDPGVFGEALREAAAQADAIVTTGGASVGDADHLVNVIGAIGRLEFWKVAIKPGKPFAFGQVGGSWLFGLPGNPAAVSVTFRQLVRPILLQLMGAAAVEPLRLAATCANRLEKSPGRLEFQRGVFRRRSDGELEVSGLSGQGSHRLTTLSRANCLIVLPIDNAGVEPGEKVDIEPLDLAI